MSSRFGFVPMAKRVICWVLARTRPDVPQSATTSATRAYYRVSDSCQIPELATLYDLFFGQRLSGFFVEVGAYDGESFSNSSCLADRGWAGLLIEPVPMFAQKCRLRHAANTAVTVEEVAIGADDGEVTLHVADALTTSNSALLSAYRDIDWAQAALHDVTEIRVPRRRLDDLLKDHGVMEGFDLLVVDVEGGEHAVFAGFDLDRWRPTMLIVELSDTHPDLQADAAAYRRLALEITDHGYCIVYRDMINTVFVRRDVYVPAVGSSVAEESSINR